MLIYFDGMKWNCLAQRYLYTSTCRGFQVSFQPAQHFKIMDLTWTLFGILFVPPRQANSVLWELFSLLVKPKTGKKPSGWSPVFKYRWIKTMRTNQQCQHLSQNVEKKQLLYMSVIIQINTVLILIGTPMLRLSLASDCFFCCTSVRFMWYPSPII